MFIYVDIIVVEELEVFVEIKYEVGELGFFQRSQASVVVV